ncbi:MAG: glycine cleavage system protein GcvH [Rhodospirillales bacterium]|jgi:glycine cleavage system H protein
MAEIKYTRDHEWIRIEDGIGVVGITDYAQEQLGDVVFVELPDVGNALSQGKDAAVVESVKAASEVYAPLNGAVLEINTALPDSPEMVNSDPSGAGWFYKMSIAEPAQLADLMDADAYAAYIADL